MLYAVAVLAGATAIAATLRRPTTLPLAALLIVELHLCYGSGVLRGLTERTRPVPPPEVRSWVGAERPPAVLRPEVEPQGAADPS